MESELLPEALDFPKYTGCFSLKRTQDNARVFTGSFEDYFPRLGSGSMLAKKVGRMPTASNRSLSPLAQLAYEEHLTLVPSLLTVSVPPSKPLLLIFFAKLAEYTEIQQKLILRHEKARKPHEGKGLFTHCSYFVNDGPDGADAIINSCNIVLACMGEQGLVPSAHAMNYFLSHFRPSFTFTIGVCGGSADTVKKACLIWKAYYDDPVRVKPGGEVTETGLTSFGAVECSTADVMKQFSKRVEQSEQSILTSVLSSTILDNDPGARLHLFNETHGGKASNCRAYEMEIWSIFYASQKHNVPCLGAVKGVSDDGKPVVGPDGKPVDNEALRKQNYETALYQAWTYAWDYLNYWAEQVFPRR